MKKGLFDEYLNHSDPEVRRRADNWGVGIGLQDVDGLSVSSYMIELAKLNTRSCACRAAFRKVVRIFIYRLTWI